MNPAPAGKSVNVTRRSLVLSSILLFLVVCAFIMLKTVRDAVFLSRFSTNSLPYFMAINTLVSAIVAGFYLHAQRRISLNTIVRISFLIFGFTAGILWLNSGSSATPAFVGGLYVWVGIVGTLAPVQAWSLVATQFLTREAKSVMGVLSGSATLGAVAGGFLSRLLSGHAPASLLILLAGGIFLAAFLACLFLNAPSTVETPGQEPHKAEKTNIRRGLIFLLLAVVATGTMVSAFIDFQFKTVTQRQLTSAGELTAFFGTFYGTLSIVALVFQFAGLPMLMNRFRLSLAAAMLPVLLLSVNIVYLFTKFFSVAVSLRGLEEVLRHSTDRASLEVVYVAMPDRVRARVKGLVETIGIRVPEALASFVLIVMFTWSHLPLTNLVIINSVLLFFWALFSFLLAHREYPRLLQDEIQRNEINLETIKGQFFTPEFFRYLPAVLRHSDKNTVLSLLDLLEESGKRWLGRYLIVGLQREEPEIRLKCLLLLFDQDSDLAQQVRPLLNDSEPKIRREAVHYICLRHRKGERMPLRSEDAQDPAMEVAALACRRKGRELTHQGMNRISELLRRSQEQNLPEVRIEISHVLKYTKTNPDVVFLYRLLLLDSSREVRLAALNSIRHTKPHEVIPELLQIATQPDLREELQNTLNSYGIRLLPNLSRIIESSSESPRRKKAALRIAVDAAGIRAFDMVLRAAGSKNLHLRFQAIKAMNRMHRRYPLSDKHEAITLLLERETHQVTTELRRLVMLNFPEDSISNRVARQRLDWAYQRVFRLLGILYDQQTIYSAYDAWSSGVAERMDKALELLEQTLTPEMRKQILPLLERPDTEKEDTTARIPALQEYLNDEDPLPAAAVIYDLPENELREQQEPLKKWTDESALMIKETLKWRLEMMTAEENEQTDIKGPLTIIQKMETLSRVPLFASLGSQEHLVLANQASEISLTAGANLFEKGEPSRDFYCIVSGRVELVSASEIVGLFGPGECIGLSDFLRGEPRILTAAARTDCVLLVITHDSFWEMLEDYSSVCHGVIQILARQVDTLTERLATRGELIQG